MRGPVLWLAILVMAGLTVAVLAPRFLSAKISWNDWAAMATLRNLAYCQAQIQVAGRIDCDGDGVGEFATFAEMTGGCGVRLDAEGCKRGNPISPAVLSPSLRIGDEGALVVKSGYCFRIVLPARGGGPTREGKPGMPLLAPVDADAAEKHWCAYAWPEEDWGELKGESLLHNRVFYVDEGGAVWQTLNQDRRYASRDRGPSWDAAMPEDGWGTAWASPPPGAVEVRGRDGNLWRKTR